MRLFLTLILSGALLTCGVAVHAEDTEPQKSATMPKKARSKHPGHYVTLSGTHFMIWGGESAGNMPKGLTTSLDGKWVFAANMGRPNKNTISVYQAIPFKLDRHLHFEGNAIEVVPSPDGKHLYFTNKKKSGFLDVVDLETFERIHHVYVPGFPKVILPDPTGAYVYLALWSGNGMARVELSDMTHETIVTKGRARYGRHGRSKNPRGMAFSPDRKTIYLANNDDRSLSFIDVKTFKERKRINTGNAPRHVVLSPDGKRAYISLTAKHKIAVLDTESEKIIRHVRVGRAPKTIAISKDGKFLYSANFRASNMTIVDTTTFETVTIPLNVLRVSGLTVHPNDDFIYISGWCTGDAWAIQRIDPDDEPLLPLGEYRRNRPCYECEMPSMGCPSRSELKKHGKW